MGDGRWVGESVRVSKVCGAYAGGGATPSLSCSSGSELYTRRSKIVPSTC